MPTRKATKAAHREYISGPVWRERRNRFMRFHPNCEECGMPRWLAAALYDQDIHVHHVSYARSGNGEEWDEDLRALCARCHEIETFGNSSLREIKSAACMSCGNRTYDVFRRCCERCAMPNIRAVLLALMDVMNTSEDPGAQYPLGTYEIAEQLLRIHPDGVRAAIEAYEERGGKQCR